MILLENGKTTIMKKFILAAGTVVFLLHSSFAQSDTISNNETVLVPLEGRAETPATLEGTWLLQSGIKIKSKSEVKLVKMPAPGTELRQGEVTTTKMVNGEQITTTEVEVVKVSDPGKQVTQPQGNRLHYPEKPGISFYGENQTLSGFSGCNKFSGRYSAKGNHINIETDASTQMACIGQYDEKEFMDKLKKVNKYKVDNGKLELMKGDNVELVFTRK